MKKIFICIIIFLFFLWGYKAGQYSINKNENNSVIKYSGNYTNLIKYNEGKDCNATILYTFDTDDRLINCRIKYIFTDEKIANEQFENWKNVNTIINLKINSSTITFNDTTYLGSFKNKILNENDNIIEF